jgi:hypothetical protein
MQSWDILAVQHLYHGHVAMDKGSFYYFCLCSMGHNVWPMVLSVIYPTGMLHSSLGQSYTSASVPWATMNDPWSCLSFVPWPCCIHPLDLLLLQHLSHGPQCMAHGSVCHLSHRHVAFILGTILYFSICPMGHNQWPMVLSVICPGTCCNHPWDLLILQTLSHGPPLMAHGPVCHLSHRHIAIALGTL